MRKFSRNEYRLMPPKSGGVTTRLAIFLEDADIAGSDWRISTSPASP